MLFYTQFYFAFLLSDICILNNGVLAVVDFIFPWATTFNDELGHYCKHQEEPAILWWTVNPMFSPPLCLLLFLYPLSLWYCSLHGVTLRCDPKTTSSLSQRKGSFHLALCSHSLHVSGTKESLKPGLCVTRHVDSRANQIKAKIGGSPKVANFY